MPKRIPVQAAKDVAKAHGCRQVIIAAWDGERTHVVTYGVNTEECAQAAEGGNKIKDALGWPESIHAEPPRVKALKDKINDLEARIESVSLAHVRVEMKLLDEIRDRTKVIKELYEFVCRHAPAISRISHEAAAGVERAMAFGESVLVPVCKVNLSGGESC